MNIIENRSGTVFPEFRRIAAREGDCRRQEQGISCPPRGVLPRYPLRALLPVGIETSTQTLQKGAPFHIASGNRKGTFRCLWASGSRLNPKIKNAAGNLLRPRGAIARSWFAGWTTRPGILAVTQQPTGEVRTPISLPLTACPRDRIARSFVRLETKTRFGSVGERVIFKGVVAVPGFGHFGKCRPKFYKAVLDLSGVDLYQGTINVRIDGRMPHFPATNTQRVPGQDEIDLVDDQDILITPCAMKGRPGFWILPVFKGTWDPNPAGHFRNHIIEISLTEKIPNIAPGLTVSIELPSRTSCS